MSTLVSVPDVFDPVVSSTEPLIARTTAETGTVLDKWATKDEQKLRDALAYIEQAQARRNMALAALDGALEKAGVDPTVRDALVQNASSIRAALAAFDLSRP